MKSTASWLVALVACVACLDAGAHAQVTDRAPGIAERVPLKILVIQPKTERLVHFADVSILTGETPAAAVCKGSTGRTGEPFDAEAHEPLDPALKTLVVVASLDRISGRTEILYDPKLDAWQHPDRYEFDEEAGDWRRLVFQATTGDWQLYMYDYAAGRWRVEGTYKYHAARDRWWLWWFDYGTGTWWQRNLYERERMLGQAEARWKLSRVRRLGDVELSYPTRKEEENWRLPANDSGPQPVRVRMDQAHEIPVWISSQVLPGSEWSTVPAYHVPAPGCCR